MRARRRWHPSKWQDFWDFRVGHVLDRLDCLVGRHRVKFSSYPQCITCGRIPKEKRS